MSGTLSRVGSVASSLFQFPSFLKDPSFFERSAEPAESVKSADPPEAAEDSTERLLGYGTSIQESPMGSSSSVRSSLFRRPSSCAIGQRRFSIPNIFSVPEASHKVDIEYPPIDTVEGQLERYFSRTKENRYIKASLFSCAFIIDKEEIEDVAQSLSIVLNDVGLVFVHVALFSLNILVSLGRILENFPEFQPVKNAHIPCTILGDIGFVLNLISQGWHIWHGNFEMKIVFFVFTTATVAVNLAMFRFPDKMSEFLMAIFPIFMFFPIVSLVKDILNYRRYQGYERVLERPPSFREEREDLISPYHHTHLISNLLSMRNFFMIIKLVFTYCYLVDDYALRRHERSSGEIEKAIFASFSAGGALVEAIMTCAAWYKMSISPYVET
jgi:hypothetical protein